MVKANASPRSNFSNVLRFVRAGTYLHFSWGVHARTNVTCDTFSSYLAPKTKQQKTSLSAYCSKIMTFSFSFTTAIWNQ